MESRFVFGAGLFLVVVSLVAGCNWARHKVGHAESNDLRVGSGDEDFVRAAVHSNVAEIKLAELALTKSTDPRLREIASVLRHDHQKSLQSLLIIANSRKMAVPDLKKIPTEHKISYLASLGADFDKIWCAEMIGKHESNFQILESVWESTDNDDIRAMINAALPHLVAHLESLVDYQEHYGSQRPDAVAASAGTIAGN